MPGGFKPQFFPNLQGIMRLFSRPITAASLLVHLLSINLFAARSLYLAGAQALCCKSVISTMFTLDHPGSPLSQCMQVCVTPCLPGSVSSCVPRLGPWDCYAMRSHAFCCNVRREVQGKGRLQYLCRLRRLAPCMHAGEHCLTRIFAADPFVY